MENKKTLTMSASVPKLRIVTYMCPTHPVQLYELIMEALEEAIGCHATLQYESRTNGPFPDRPDPFANDEVDLAFMTALAYMHLREKKNSNVELLPVSPVFHHPKNIDHRPGYYADIIIHRDKKTHNVNGFKDLRGCNFAFSSEDSLSGSNIILKTLSEKGENASFFGSLLKSGSHLASAQMVLSKQAECASVDSTCLLYSKKYMHDGGCDIVILDSLGPLPPFPVVVNAKLPAETKKNVTNTLLKLSQSKEWQRRFGKYGLVKFAANSNHVYDTLIAQMRTEKSHSFSVRYY